MGLAQNMSVAICGDSSGALRHGIGPKIYIWNS